MVALLLFDSQALTVELALETQDYYLAKTLETQALKLSKTMTEGEFKKVNFNKGNVNLEKQSKNKKIKVKTCLNNGYQLYNNLSIE